MGNTRENSADSGLPGALTRATYDPERFRRDGHRAVDLLADYLGAALGRAEMPVLPWVDPDAMAQNWPPEFPEDASEDLIPWLGRIVSAANHLHHPRYMGHQVSGPMPAGALCDFVCALLNNSPTVYEMSPAGAAMERSVVRWMAQALGMGHEADGILTSGGSVGNLTALLAARQLCDTDSDERPPAFLVSEQAHYSVARAFHIMGWDAESIEPVPVDAAYRLRAAALEPALRRAGERGRRVIGVAAAACSTATGTYDELGPIADFCEAHGLWLHVDAAHGAAACLSARHRHLLDGIARADSVVWDAHKMMMMPALASGVLFKRGEHSYATFEDKASYLYEHAAREEWYNMGHRTIECTKPTSCVKVYLALRCFGTRVFGDYVDQTYALARRFAELLAAAPDFECAVTPEANIVCFRYLPPGGGDLDAVQPAIRRRLLDDGRFYIVQTHLASGVYLRTTLMNPFTTERDLQELMDAIRGAHGPED